MCWAVQLFRANAYCELGSGVSWDVGVTSLTRLTVISVTIICDREFGDEECDDPCDIFAAVNHGHGRLNKTDDV